MLREILTESMIVSNAKVSNWKEAVEVVGGILVKNNKVDKAFIKSMIDVVEEFGPYMILIPEVAFFHGRPGLNVYEPCLSLAVLADPVNFSEFENQKITCAFGFGAIDNESHLKMLIEISELLQNKKFIDLITNNGSKEEILEVIRNIEEKNYVTE